MTLTQIFNILCRFSVKMTSKPSLLISPIDVRGMTVLDREKFTRKIPVPLLIVPDNKLSKVAQLCRSYFLKVENYKPVQDFSSDTSTEKGKIIILNPDSVNDWSSISESIQKELIKNEIDESNFSTKEIELGYDNWKYETIFKAVLPENKETVSGFTQIGHIIHLNLRDHLLNYKHLIGQVLLDKVKTCRTVINKSHIIDNTYRNFSIEVLAGEEDFLVTVKENNCNFQFDFSKVYWNSRLGKEHERIVTSIKQNDVLFDVFCGVGPFAVPVAKRKCKVYANDLNPESFKWLNHNAKTNKIDSAIFKSYNLDGKEFICTVFKDFLIEYCKGSEKLNEDSTIHVTMNLPAMAVEFLKNFRGLLKDKDIVDKFTCNIKVYVYCFATGDNPKESAKQMVIDNFGCDVSAYILDIFNVRNVSPKKEMMRVTLRLSKDIIFNLIEESTEPPQKKLCIEM